MEIYIYNQSFELIRIIDVFVSLLWNEKFCGYGDFELILPYNDMSVFDYIKMDNYVSIKSSNKWMIIEKIDNDYSEGGYRLVVSGRSLESILTRRIVWNQSTIDGNLQDAIIFLVNESFSYVLGLYPLMTEERNKYQYEKQINGDEIIEIIERPLLGKVYGESNGRIVLNFVIERSTDDEITSLELDVSRQFTGDNLYDVIKALCEYYGIGFQLLFEREHSDTDIRAFDMKTNVFSFKLIKGTDRTEEVEFSYDFDNLISSAVHINRSTFKNVALVAGEGEGQERKTTTYGETTGLLRRELYVDARDLQQVETDDPNDTTEMTDDEYELVLMSRGKEKLVEYGETKDIEAEIDTTNLDMYQLNRDYYLGDTVRIRDHMDNISMAKITEVTTTISSNEISTYPIFEIIQTS